MPEQRILVTGASGQIGTDLVQALSSRYGEHNIVATDIQHPSYDNVEFVILDILNVQRTSEVLDDYCIDKVFHLAAILSASGEWNPQKTWNVNMSGLLSLLELSVEKKIRQVFFPSTIAVFGGPTPKVMTPQHGPMIPSTVYGISKLSGELWCNYYFNRYGLDVRSLRYPGIISHEAMPGGGTTDYAVEIFHAALDTGSYNCFVREDTQLPMLYMDDAIRATIELMEAPSDSITVRTSYNLAGLSFSAGELAAEIRKHLPGLEVRYVPDFRQEIADNWTGSIDDSPAREDWGWTPKFDLPSLVEDMFRHLRPRYS